MTETNIGFLASGCVGGLAVACALYQWGGRDGGPGKGVRRFGASVIITTIINIVAVLLKNWSSVLLACYASAILTFIQGYGGNSFPKILQRILIVISALITGAICAWVFGCWWLLVVQGIVAAGTIFFAIKNPIQAAAEEVLVCFLLYGVCLFYPFVVK